MTIDFSGKELDRFDFREFDLRGANFSDCIIKNSHFFSKDMTGANFSNATLMKTAFTDVKLNEAIFDSVRLDGVSLTYSQVHGVSATRINFGPGLLGESEFCDVDFSDSSIAADFKNCKFEKVKFRQCSFDRMRIESCSFFEPDFVQSGMKKCTFDNSHILQGDFKASKIGGRNHYESACYFNQSVLTHSSFEGTDLENVEFTKCDLGGSSFVDGKIRDCQFKWTDLSTVNIERMTFKGLSGGGALVDLSNRSLVGCDFSGVLGGIDFSNSDLSSVSFRGASILDLNFRGATLQGTDFSGARLVGSPEFDECDLDSAIFHMTDVTRMSIGMLRPELGAFFSQISKEYLNSDSQRELQEERGKNNFRSPLIERKNSDGEFIGYVEEVSYDEYGRSYKYDSDSDSFRRFDD